MLQLATHSVLVRVRACFQSDVSVRRVLGLFLNRLLLSPEFPRCHLDLPEKLQDGHNGNLSAAVAHGDKYKNYFLAKLPRCHLDLPSELQDRHTLEDLQEQL